MCDLPGCPANDEPEEITPENRNRMRLECTSAAMHCMTTFARGWTQGAQGILADISDSWGFPGITRTMYCLAATAGILPRPKDSLIRATPDSIREKLTQVAGEDVAESMATHMVVVGDQVNAGFEELCALAAKGHENQFEERFDTITDQPNMLQPLLATLMMYASVSFRDAQRLENTFALDQLQTAMRAGIELGADDEARAEVDALKAAFDLPDAPREG